MCGVRDPRTPGLLPSVVHVLLRVGYVILEHLGLVFFPERFHLSMGYVILEHLGLVFFSEWFHLLLQMACSALHTIMDYLLKGCIVHLRYCSSFQAIPTRSHPPDHSPGHTHQIPEPLALNRQLLLTEVPRRALTRCIPYISLVLKSSTKCKLLEAYCRLSDTETLLTCFDYSE